MPRRFRRTRDPGGRGSSRRCSKGDDAMTPFEHIGGKLTATTLRRLAGLAAIAALLAFSAPAHAAGDLAEADPDRGDGRPRQARAARLRAEPAQVRDRQALQADPAQPERRPALLHVGCLHADDLHPQGAGDADARRQDRHARRIQGRDPRDRGLSRPRRRVVVRAGRGRARDATCAAASSARTARATPSTAWSARS